MEKYSIGNICLFIVVVTFFCSIMRAETPVLVRNMTDVDVFGAVYTKPKDTSYSARRFKEPVVIRAGQSQTIERPDINLLERLTNDRVLFFSVDQELLEPELQHEKSLSIPSTNVGDIIRGGEFFIGYNELGELSGYSAFEWHVWRGIKQRIFGVVNPVIEHVVGALNPLVEKVRQLYMKESNNPYYNKKAYVRDWRKNPGQSLYEKTYITRRLANVPGVWKKLFGQEISEQDAPYVAFCISGGGFRAMVGAMGFFLELEKMGLLDLGLYVSTLSGSTWFLGPWLSSGMSLQEFKQSVLRRVARGLIDPRRFAQDSVELAKILPLFATQVFRKVAFKQPINFIDFYGFALAQMLLKELTEKNPESFTLSQQQKRLARADVPFPIYTAAIDKSFPHWWMEFNPYEVGSVQLGGFVPSWSFGRTFSNGVSTNFAPPLTLSYCMAIWGSAMALNFKDVYYIALKKMRPKTIFQPLAKKVADTTLGDIRFTVAPVNNFTYNMRGLPFAEEKLVGLVDAGVSFGIPLPPLMRSERDINMIIVADCSAGALGAELRKTDRWFKAFNLKFPVIDWDTINNTSSLWYDENDPEVPVVVYIPHVKNDTYNSNYDPQDHMGTGGYLNTVNVVYSQDNIEKYSGLMQANTRDALDTIKKGLIIAQRNLKKRM